MMKKLTNCFFTVAIFTATIFSGSYTCAHEYASGTTCKLSFEAFRKELLSTPSNPQGITAIKIKTVKIERGLVYQDTDGKWGLKFNLNLCVENSGNHLLIKLSNITFAAGTQAVTAIEEDPSPYSATGLVHDNIIEVLNQSNLIVPSYSSVGRTITHPHHNCYAISGDVQLDKRPNCIN